MAKYKVVWQSHLYGESMVEANSLEEAKAKALNGKSDETFEQRDPNSDWEIESVTEME